MTQQLFYRNNRFLRFKIFENIEDFKGLLPTVIIYADNGQFVYQPYIFKEVSYVKTFADLKADYQVYFILLHEVYSNDRIDTILTLIENDLKSGYYFPFGEIQENPLC